MENRIKLELRGRKPNEVADLILDNCRTPQIQGLTDEYVNLETLSLIHAGLTTLKGFPNLPHLKRVDLSDNQLTGGLDLLCGCPEITHLNLSGNKVKDIETLKPLEKLKSLISLDLLSCEVNKAAEYRDKVFEALPQLKYLDGYDKDGNEQEESEEEDFDEEITDEEEDEDSEGEEDGEEGAPEEDEEGSEDDEEGDEQNDSHGTKRKHDEEEDD